MKTSKTMLGVIGALALMSLLTQDAHAQTPTARIVRNANAFMSTLDESQRARLLFNFDDEAQRVRWSNLPTSFSKAPASAWQSSARRSGRRR